MENNWILQLSEEIESLKQSGLLRRLREITPSSGNKFFCEGREVVDFSSNDYLGLASDSRLVGASVLAMREFGVGAGASRLISGNKSAHVRLERKLAQFKHQEEAIVFPTGYMANIGCITSIMNNPDDLIVADKLVHASLFDACRFSKASFRVYEHNDVDSLESVLKRHGAKKKVLIVTDGVFSMDGDLAPVYDLGLIAQQYGAWLMVDDAHGMGVLGETGAGTAEHLRAEHLVHIHMGTLSKACGALGGFVAGTKHLKEILINKARSFIYTTGIPPALCCASIEALNIIESHPDCRLRLMEMGGYVRTVLLETGFSVPAGITPIIPVIIKDNVAVMDIVGFLVENGVLVGGIRYPTVAKDQARLRISLKATHTDDEICVLIEAMRKTVQKYGGKILVDNN